MSEAPDRDSNYAYDPLKISENGPHGHGNGKLLRLCSVILRLARLTAGLQGSTPKNACAILSRNRSMMLIHSTT